MKFIVEKDVFNELPDLFFGVVIGINIDNTKSNEKIKMDLEQACKGLTERLEGINLKQYEAILPYREAFQKVSINPNKFMSSIEAMAKRVQKGTVLPSINPVVDMVNTLSLTHILPMGAHDLDQLSGNIHVRFSKENDPFIPLGKTEQEHLPTGELVYSDDERIRTRRWIWRQSDIGKITEESTNIFFPIDGFESRNKEAVLKAVEGLKTYIEALGGEYQTFTMDKENNEIEF